MFSACFLIMFSYEESDRYIVMDNRQVICLGVYSQADELTVRHGLCKQLQIPRFPLTNNKKPFLSIIFLLFFWFILLFYLFLFSSIICGSKGRSISSERVWLRLMRRPVRVSNCSMRRQGSSNRQASSYSIG